MFSRSVFRSLAVSSRRDVVSISHNRLTTCCNGSIELIMGPMFSGKSTQLLARLREVQSQAQDNTVILVKHSSDDRYQAGDSETFVVTHNQDRFPALSTHHLSNPAIQVALMAADVVGIDEGQFFPDLADHVDLLANAGKRVIVASLDGTFRRESFEQTSKLIPKVEKVDKLSASCRDCGKPAAFSLRLSQEKETCVIGGEDKYRATCRACYNKATQQ